MYATIETCTFFVRVCAQYEVYYEVQWEGFDESQNTWEPADSLTSTGDAAVYVCVCVCARARSRIRVCGCSRVFYFGLCKCL